MNYYKTSKIVAGAVIVSSMFAPLTSFAADEGVAQKKGICTKISAVTQKTQQKIANLTSKIESNIGKRNGNISEKRSARDKKLTDNRIKQDQRLASRFAALEAKAKTDEEKQAVIKFKEAVQAAIVIRRESVDKSISDFRIVVNQNVASNGSEKQAMLDGFKNSTNAAIEKANSDCGSGVEGKSVKTTLRQSLQASKDSLKSDRQEIEKVKASVESAKVASKQVIEKAIQDYKSAFEKAKNDLKLVLSEK